MRFPKNCCTVGSTLFSHVNIHQDTTISPKFCIVNLTSIFFFQRLAWEALKKSINGLINKVNSPNIGIIVRELFKENIVRGDKILRIVFAHIDYIIASLGS